MWRLASIERAEDDPCTGDRPLARHFQQSRLEKHARYCDPRILCIWLEGLQTRVLGGVSTRDVLLRRIPATHSGRTNHRYISVAAGKMTCIIRKATSSRR